MNCITVLFVGTIVLSCFSPCFINAQEYVTVRIQEGDVRGQVESTRTNKTMYSFRGIPYAEPPVGDLRFQPPVTKAAWTGVRDALEFGSACTQATYGSEDCLYLNVFTPAMPTEGDALKAVMVWIHGGCFTAGKANLYKPHYFVDNDVVFVSMNYRLGLLGFLSTGDEVVPGNMALKDQVEALRWVQRNVAAFGGDPERVTIFGQSAGGASIHYHVLSPLSKDSQSIGTCVWAPSAEPEHDGAFLTEEPWRLVAEGRYNRVPFMSGVTDLELVNNIHGNATLATEEGIRHFNENFEAIIGCDLRLPTRAERLNGARAVKQFYYNGSDITVQDNFTTALLDSHMFFVEGVDAVVRNMANYSSEPVYYYEFTYNDGPFNRYPEGVGHAIDIAYMFLSFWLDPTSDGAILRDQMTAMWTNFAKYDNPTPELNSMLTQKWEAYNESLPFYMELTSPLKPGMRLYEPYMNFWHGLLPY